MNNVDASSFGDVVFLRGDANTSEALEEVFHFQQQMRVTMPGKTRG